MNDFSQCSVDGCGRNAHWRAKGVKGMCLAHYKKVRKYGDATAGAGRVDNSGECSVDGCSRGARSMGLCNSHYLRQRAQGTPQGLGHAMRGEPLNFVVNVASTFEGDDCLSWPYSRNKAGYGTIYQSKGKTTVVSRMVCAIVHGEPESPDLHALHSCGNGHLGCVNPRHLNWGTARENMADKVGHGTDKIKARGVDAPSSKLNDDDVRAIRVMSQVKGNAEIAKQYGVTSASIRNILIGKTWKHVL